MSLVENRKVYPSSQLYVTLPGNPFRLGYRWVRHTLPDGTIERNVTPLLPEDLLFPEEEDRPVVRPEHTTDCITLYIGFKILTARLPGALVLMDHRVDFGVPGIDPLGPDVAVFRDVPTTFRPTLRVAELGANPVVVVEVTSPDNSNNDLVTKVDYYYRSNVACYVIIDSRYDEDFRLDARLIGYRHTPDGYEPIPLDDQGRLRVEPLSCWLKIENKQVVCIDPTGQPIEEPVGLFQAKEDAVAQAHAAEAQAQAAQAQAAEARTRTEIAARLDLEARMAVMAEQLRRLQGEG